MQLCDFFSNFNKYPMYSQQRPWLTPERIAKSLRRTVAEHEPLKHRCAEHENLILFKKFQCNADDNLAPSAAFQVVECLDDSHPLGLSVRVYRTVQDSLVDPA